MIEERSGEWSCGQEEKLFLISEIFENEKIQIYLHMCKNEHNAEMNIVQ